jgi:hypothetical protein
MVGGFGMTPRLRAIVLVGICLLGLGACGKKGPPDPPGPPDKITFPKTYPTH